MSPNRFGLLVLGLALVVTTAHAGPPSGPDDSGGWARETRQIGNKVTVDHFARRPASRAPYALTGSPTASGGRESPEWVHETRRIGNKVTHDVFVR